MMISSSSDQPFPGGPGFPGGPLGPGGPTGPCGPGRPGCNKTRTSYVLSLDGISWKQEGKDNYCLSELSSWTFLMLSHQLWYKLFTSGSFETVD